LNVGEPNEGGGEKTGVGRVFREGGGKNFLRPFYPLRAERKREGVEKKMRGEKGRIKV